MAMTDKERAYWLADKIPAYGDYAKEAALVLQQQADAVERYDGVLDIQAKEITRLLDENDRLRNVLELAQEWGIASRKYNSGMALALGVWVAEGGCGDVPEVPEHLLPNEK